VPFDKVLAEEIPYGTEVRVEKSVGDDLIGMKRAVKKEEFSAAKYPAPAHKLRLKKGESAKTDPPAKSLDQMNKAELLEAAKTQGVEVPEGATKAEILELLTSE